MLDAFVRISDEQGGPNSPGCGAYWRDFTYKPTVVVDETQDPFGPEYMAAQLDLYHELSGRTLNQAENEHTRFDMPAHVAAVNPYGPHDPAAAALHTCRLSRAIMTARPRLGARVLDMGCGWGLSSEFAAYLGLDVTGVDINPDFVSLVNQRAALRGTQVRAVYSTFDDYVPDGAYDLILFYECLHHAVRPWAVIERLVRSLAPGGAVALAEEPINEAWRHWKMRLDPLSIYCIRKFDWFESGWSLEFIKSVFARADMRVETDCNPSLGYTLVARPTSAEQAALARVAQGRSATEYSAPKRSFATSLALLFAPVQRLYDAMHRVQTAVSDLEQEHSRMTDDLAALRAEQRCLATEVARLSGALASSTAAGSHGAQGEMPVPTCC